VRLVKLRVPVSCVLFGLAACNTYTSDLLTGSGGTASVGGSSGGFIGGGGASTVGGSASPGGATVIAGTGGSSVVNAGTSGIGDGGADEAGSPGVGGTAGVSSGGHAGAGGAGGGSGGAAAGSTSGGAAGSGVTAGSGGTVATGGSGGSSGIELIDSFEQDTAGQTTLLTLPLSHGRNGPWYEFDDATAAGTKSFAAAALTAPLVASSKIGLHLTASGFTGFGAGFGADFVNAAGAKAPYDVSAYSGIRFYAKIGAGAQSTLMLLIPTTYSDPMGGKCDPSSAATAATKCNDHLFCQFLGITTTWALYECDFKDLTQQRFGLPQPTLDPKSVYSVQFTFATKTLAADFWLDDISFVLKPASG
jgi:hypothetical protein